MSDIMNTVSAGPLPPTKNVTSTNWTSTACWWITTSTPLTGFLRETESVYFIHTYSMLARTNFGALKLNLYNPLLSTDIIMDNQTNTTWLFLPRKTWSRLNRIRTNCGARAASLFRWGKSETSTCDCGEESQTIHHVAYDCENRSSHCTTEDFLRATPSAVIWIENLNVNV